jgi:hypothetical protein
MSIYKSSSLAMIPTAYKDGKLYSIRPTDGSGDFTFSRGSNLAATRVDVNGLIEKGRENLLLQSNTFSNASWLKELGASVTGNQSGYDGSSDAWQLDTDGTQYSRLRQVVSGSGVQTFSLYAKAGTLDWIGLYNGGGSAAAFFDLTNGVTGNLSSSNIDASITSVGGGWYRCEYSFNESITDFRIYPTGTNGTFTTTAGNIYIQAAQLEQSMVATDVISTGATTAQSGILEDLPRLDYSGGASCPSLLLESQRTNIQPNSEYVNAYTKSRSTITTNATTSPEGVSNASKVIPLSTSTGWSGINAPNYSFTSGQTYTLSVFAKAGEYNYCQVGGSTPAFNGSFATINLTNGVVEHESGITASTEDYGNGWYRISFTHTAIATASSPIGFFAVYSTAVSSRLVAQVGDNVSGVYIFGWMAELGSYPTSYIPTMGSAVTRSADSCNKTGISDLIGQTEGVAFCEVNMSSKTLSSSWAFSLNDGTTSNYIGLRRSGGNELFVHINVGGTTTALIGTGITTGTHKIGIAYANNDISVYVDGVNVGIDTSSAVPATSVIEIGDLVSNRYFDDSIKQFLLFKTRLTNTELASLTTL